jgi:hypothetical protein
LSHHICEAAHLLGVSPPPRIHPLWWLLSFLLLFSSPVILLRLRWRRVGALPTGAVGPSSFVLARSIKCRGSFGPNGYLEYVLNTIT